MRLTTKGLLLIAIPAVFELALLSGLVKAQVDAAQAEGGEHPVQTDTEKPAEQ
jgi:hypothetical protein